MFCPYCLKRIPEDSKFCPFCGKHIERGFSSIPYSSPNAALQSANRTGSAYKSPKSEAANSYDKRSEKILYAVIGAVILIIAIIICVVSFSRFNFEDEDESAVPSTVVTRPVPTLEPIPMAEPYSGEVLSGYEDYDGSEITVTAPSNASCVVRLKSDYDDDVLSFFVAEGETVTMHVPCEKLYTYFACGQTWYGEDLLFGDDTAYSKDDNPCDFSQYTMTYTLQPVENGNFSATTIDPDEF